MTLETAYELLLWLMGFSALFALGCWLDPKPSKVKPIKGVSAVG